MIPLRLVHLIIPLIIIVHIYILLFVLIVRPPVFILHLFPLPIVEARPCDIVRHTIHAK
jgi:hypothetical protein